MRLLLPLLFFLASPFWETKPPEKWTSREIDILLHYSPWIRTVGPAPEVRIYLATARPVEEAEMELRIRSPRGLPELDPDYAQYLSRNRDRNLVLAISYPGIARITAGEERKMEDESAMLVRGKVFKMIGHFPPAPTDPVLRLVFPREVRQSDKDVLFRLYIPAIDFPEREVEFKVKELIYHGNLQM